MIIRYILNIHSNILNLITKIIKYNKILLNLLNHVRLPQFSVGFLRLL